MNRLIFSSDGKTLASGGGWDHNVHLWDVGTGKVKHILRGHTNEIRDIAFSPKGETFITASKDKTISVWDVGSGTRSQHFPTPGARHEKLATGRKIDDVFAMQFFKTGEHFITISRAGTVYICDVETGHSEQIGDLIPQKPQGGDASSIK